MRKTIYVAEVIPKKTGQKKDGSIWTLYYVVDENKMKYSTFEDRFIALVGMQTTIDYVDEPYTSKTDGKQYMSHKILELGQKPVEVGMTRDGMDRANNPHNHNPLPPQEVFEINKRIAALESRVGQLEINSADPNAEFNQGTVPNEVDSADNLPF